MRVAERNAVIPFMNGDFTQWNLYLASSSEYAMRLIDGFISMLESRNLVCVAQLLRAQVGVCLRTFALFAHMTQSAVKSHNGPADRLQSVGGACR